MGTQEQVVVRYDMLLCMEPSPVTRLHCIAVRYAASPAAALAELTELSDALDGYHLYHATRAELLRVIGQPVEARLADERALALTNNPGEQQLLRQRLNWGQPAEVREYVHAP